MANNIGYLEGVMHYAFIFEKKDKYDRWSVALVLEGDQIKNAKKFGVKINQSEDKYDGLPHVQLKSGFQPKLFNADDTDYSGPTMLANGSRGVVRITQRPYDNKFGKGITTYMNAVKITKPIAYQSEEGSGSFGSDSEENIFTENKADEF